MEQPIAIGTILQNRYRIIQTLGQGGFGRTYLAEDQRRFNELCAIKELIPTVTGAFGLEKAQELFLREAAILYQIKHEQVPQFRERFEQDQRLFLVQEYIPGKTYRTLLNERKAVGGAFTEKEVVYLLSTLLPVLEHIHSRGIIHRDISPENIILRDSDRLPVLIDFGVVKELATRLQSPDTTASATYVGKLGYSPSEQMQSGRAYANSDLYALAVTAVVLLTGKEPQELFDENHLSWHWQAWVTLNPQFAQILNRMLSYRPSDRYQSATEVLQDLQSLEPITLPTSQVSNVQTLAVGHLLDPAPPASPKRPDPTIPQQTTNPLRDNPFVIGAVGSAIVILAGLGSWTLVSSIPNQSEETQTRPTPQNFPSPLISPSATPTPTPTPRRTPTKNQPVIFTKSLNFGLSNTTSIEGMIKTNQIHQYILNGKQGEKLTALFSQENGVSLSVLGSDAKPIENSAKNVTFYQGTLPFTGVYIIQVNPVPGISQSSYSLSIRLDTSIKPTPTPTPSLTAIPPTTLPPVEKLPTLPPTEKLPTTYPHPQEQNNPHTKTIPKRIPHENKRGTHDQSTILVPSKR